MATVQVDLALCTEEDLDRVGGKNKVSQLFAKDDGSGTRDEQAITEQIAAASNYAALYLKLSWEDENRVQQLSNDIAIRDAIAWVAMEFRSESKGEFIANDGKGRYWVQFERSTDMFKQLAKGNLRAAGEKKAGETEQKGGRIRPTLNPTNKSRFVFAPDPISGRLPGRF